MSAQEKADPFFVILEKCGELIMSGETEIEISVVSEAEDLDCENSNSPDMVVQHNHHQNNHSHHHHYLLLQDKAGKMVNNNPYGFEGTKATLRPVCNPQYTSFSISSILGRSESPSQEAASPSGKNSSNNNNNSDRSGNNNNNNNSSSNSNNNNNVNNNGLSGGISNSRVTSNGHSPTRIRIVSPSAKKGSASSATGTTSPLSTASFAVSEAAAAGSPLLGHQASADFTMLSR